MDCLFTASIRCAEPREGGGQCGKESSYEKFTGAAEESNLDFLQEAGKVFQQRGWLVGPPKACRCPDHA